MKYVIQNENKEPAYMQLYRQLRNDITDEVLRYGDKLPSKRILAEETGVSVITVEHAYDILIEEGYLEARQRSGYFVRYLEKDQLNVADQLIPRHQISIKTERSDEEFPFSVYARTLRRVLSLYDERVMERSPHNGCFELRQALSDYLIRSRGISAKADRIVIGAGAEYLYGLLIQLLGRTRIYGLEDPCYDTIRKVYRSNGVRLDLLKMGRDGIVTHELERTPSSVLHVTPYNSFPSGISASASKRREYLNWAHDQHRFIIEDDFDSEFSSLTKTEDTLVSLDEDGSVIYINSFTKTISPSIRCAYIILPEKLMKQYENQLNFYSCPVPLLEQYVLAELLNSGEFERHINRIRRRRRRQMQKNG